MPMKFQNAIQISQTDRCSKIEAAATESFTIFFTNSMLTHFIRTQPDHSEWLNKKPPVPKSWTNTVKLGPHRTFVQVFVCVWSIRRFTVLPTSKGFPWGTEAGLRWNWVRARGRGFLFHMKGQWAEPRARTANLIRGTTSTGGRSPTYFARCS